MTANRAIHSWPPINNTLSYQLDITAQLVPRCTPANTPSHSHSELDLGA